MFYTRRAARFCLVFLKLNEPLRPQRHTAMEQVINMSQEEQEASGRWRGVGGLFVYKQTEEISNE